MPVGSDCLPPLVGGPVQESPGSRQAHASTQSVEGTSVESQSTQKVRVEVGGVELVALDDGLDNVVSSTSRSFAAYRALESEHPDALFRDPLAEYLAGEATMQKQRAQIAVGSNPGGRFAVRTKYFDDALMSAVRRIKGEAPDAKVQVVIFGCGMDARAWRLPDAFGQSKPAPSDAEPLDGPTTVPSADELRDAAGLDQPSDSGPYKSSDRSDNPVHSDDFVHSNVSAVPTGSVHFDGTGHAHPEAPRHAGASDVCRRVDASGPSDSADNIGRLEKDGAAARESTADESPLVEAIFEGDRPDVIALKRRLLGELEGDGKLPPLKLARRRVMLPVNLNEDTWQDLLLEQGFRTSEPTVWLCEGLVMYLEPDAVIGLLEGAAKLSPPGSALLVSGISDLAVTRGKQSASLVRRSWTWGSRNPAAFFNAHGWHVQKVDDVTAGMYGRTLPSTVGREPNLTWYLTAVKT